ncbi:MAG: hypothetical protein OXE86_10465 [Alphaproteobacteria bacterium]|nr:hypothetical protein [Alphaproteobacteria bacterium]
MLPGLVVADPIIDRNEFCWPGGSRLAVAVILALDADNAVAERYGMSVGAWRLLEMFRTFEMPVAVAAGPGILARHPRLTAMFTARADEFVAMGAVPDQRYRDLGISMPRGLLVRGELDLASVLDAGCCYLLAACGDDQPVWLSNDGHRIGCVPIAPELDDLQQLQVHRHTPRQFAAMLSDHFDEQLRQSAHRPLVMCPVLRPHLSGQPRCLDAIRRWLAHAAEYPGVAWFCHPRDIACTWQERG